MWKSSHRFYGFFFIKLPLLFKLAELWQDVIGFDRACIEGDDSVLM